MHIVRKRKLNIPVLIGVIALTMAIIGSGLFIYNQFKVNYPKEMINVEKAYKDVGKHRIDKSKINNHFVVLHYPEVNAPKLASWITDSMNQFKETITTNYPESEQDTHQFLQDYEIIKSNDQFLSVKVTQSINNEVHSLDVRTFDTTLNDFIDGSHFKPEGQRYITHLLREFFTTHINKVTFNADTLITSESNSFFLKDNTLTIFIPYGHYELNLESNSNLLASPLGNLESTNEAIPPVYLGKDVDNTKKLVAFTFDDGPHVENTPKIIEMLKQYNATGTFFILGSRATTFPITTRTILESGHQIASHSYTHPDFRKLSIEALNEELTKTEDAVYNATGYRAKLFVRPPYGSLSQEILDQTDRIYINWNVDSNDWASRNAQSVCDTIVQTVHDGSIILLHELYDASIEGLGCAMKILANQGYAFVSVEELLRVRGYDLQGSHLYRHANRQ